MPEPLLQDDTDILRSWGMEAVLVRTAQRLLDSLRGRTCIDEGLRGPEPSQEEACQALRQLAPALMHLHARAATLCAPVPGLMQCRAGVWGLGGLLSSSGAAGSFCVVMSQKLATWMNLESGMMRD